MVRIEGLRKVYPARRGPLPVLEGVDLEVKGGEFLIIRGPSGSGKTTLLLALGGMLRPTAGRVVLDGEDVYALSPAERARLRAEKIGFVFQMFHLVPYLDVLENVLLAAGPRGGRGLRARAEEILRRLGLEGRLDHKPGALSAGERQRTAMARALLKGPRLVLADEPTGNLDPENALEVFRHLEEYHRSGGTVIVVTHGAAADPFATRIVELRSGRIHPATITSPPTAPEQGIPGPA